MDIREENKMVITDDNGNEHLVDILFTYHNDDRNKDYVFISEPGDKENVLVFEYTEDGELLDISDEEYEEADEVLAAFEAQDEAE